jgi:glycosyltransferase involved in cell wall biosynthesis
MAGQLASGADTIRHAPAEDIMLKKFLRIEDVHRAFQFVYDLSTPQRKVAVVREFSSWLRFRHRPIHLVLFFFDHLLFPLRIAFRLLFADVVLLREFSHVAAPWVLWPVRPWRRRVVLLVHRTIANPHTRFERLSNAGITTLARWGFRIMTLESPNGLLDAGVCATLVRDSQVFAVDFVFPKVREARYRAPRTRPQICVVGQIRPEKGILELLTALVTICANRGWDLRVGAPRRDFQVIASIPSLRLTDTTAASDYEKFLMDADLVCVNLQRREYMYRTSGVVSDAIANLRPVVTPALEVISRQITHPARVGICFERIDDLESAIEAALQLSNMSERFDQYFRMRTNDHVRTEFWLAMDGNKPSQPAPDKDG